ncbi:MAG: protein kinase [Cyanobacteria bacterium SZAS-4]|nr:protein kinase [Cyanobacteria bacterium SZAS-4]
MSNELVPYPGQHDCDEVLDEVALPLFDLRDTSLQALDQSNATIGDLQSQLLLAYSGSETSALVYSKSFLQSNPLGLNKFVQAFLPIPLFVGALAAFEFPAFMFGFHLDNFFYLCLMSVYFSLCAASIFALMLASVAINRRKNSLIPKREISAFASVHEPDHIAISPQGINLQWSAKFFSYMGLVLPWKRIALAYLEEHVDAETNETYEILCIRDNLGKALRLDCREFASGVLIKALQKRAPWAVKAPPMVLALQPMQQFRLNYLLQWSIDIARMFFTNRSAPEVVVGSLLKRDKYKILETSPVRRFGVHHIAEVLTGRGSSPISYKGLNSYEQTENSCSTQVKVQQFVLPPRQTIVQWYWMLNQFEREVRRLSCVNSNNITRWLDVFAENGSLFVVTEYDASATLRQIVRDRGRLPEARVREIALEMCEILIHLHQLEPPYVHKAFTPDALILAKEGEFVKLNQFAIGNQLMPSQLFGSYFDRRYTSLEQLRDQASVQSDIYAFGCTLFYLLTGEDPRPFEQSNPKSLHPEISDRFNEIVMKATEPNAHLRYDSVTSIKDAMLELANSETNLVLL